MDQTNRLFRAGEAAADTCDETPVKLDAHMTKAVKSSTFLETEPFC